DVDAGFMRDGNACWGMIVRDCPGCVKRKLSDCAGLCCGFRTKIKGR
ncbi:hypothetical protein A2U01_0109876, partial [Trifolium medium]|nr:hypothetical protein [Trifolium medium]